MADDKGMTGGYPMQRKKGKSMEAVGILKNLLNDIRPRIILPANYLPPNEFKKLNQTK